MTDIIDIYMKASNVKSLGPGNRFVIWVQGCMKRCVGCVASNGRDIGKGVKISIETLKQEFLESGDTGLTISGGEPFLQAPALVKLIKEIKKEKPISVVCYTGYLYEELKNVDEKELINLCDVLIDGEYNINLDDNKPHRGSSNQRILFINKECNQDFYDYYSLEGLRRLEIKSLNDKEIMVIGIPIKII